jgi:hypothetical protein
VKAKIDLILNKWLSRKLMVFFIATALTLVGQVDSQDWVDVALIYIGTEGAIDFATRLRGVRLPEGKDAKENNSI